MTRFVVEEKPDQTHVECYNDSGDLYYISEEGPEAGARVRKTSFHYTPRDHAIYQLVDVQEATRPGETQLLPHGEQAAWHQNGTLWKRGNFEYGVPVGVFEEFHQNGKLYRLGSYADGKLAREIEVAADNNVQELDVERKLPVDYFIHMIGRRNHHQPQ